MTRTIPMSCGLSTLVDEADWPLVAGLTLYLGTSGYVCFSTWSGGRSQPQTLHGFLMGRHPGKHVDHINGDKLDNRRSCNLRVVSPQANQANRRSLSRKNTSGYRGVFRRKGDFDRPWVAQISVRGQTIHLGVFATAEEAQGVRKAAEIEHFGEACP